MDQIVLVNPQTGDAQSFDQQSAAQAIQSGFEVPLNDAQGNPVTAPYHEAAKLVSEGSHAQPHPEQLQYLLNKTHYESPSQQALTFIEGALEPNTFGAYGKIATESGLTTPEDMRNRQEFNPGTHALGEGAGFVGGLYLAPEASVPGLISKVGRAAEVGIKAEGLFGKAAQLATRNAIEGGLFTATHEIGEHLLGDPNSSGENILANIGMGAALSGGLGIALSPIASAAEKAIGMGRGYFGMSVPDASRVVESGGSMAELIPHTGISKVEQEGVLKGLSELKPNASEIKDAANILGAPVLESQISNSHFVQDLDSTLMKSPSWTGIKRQQLAQEGFNAVNDALDSSLGSPMQMSKADAGEAIKTGLIDKFNEESKPISEIYNQIKSVGQDVPLEPSFIKSAANDMTNIDGLLSSVGKPISEGSPGYQLAKRVSEELPNLGNVNDLRLYAQRIGQDTVGKPELKYVAGQIQKKLSDLEERAVLKFADEAMPDAKLLIEEHKAAKKAYGSLRDKMEEIGDVVGKKLRRGEGVTAFTDWLSETAPEKIADKLFTKNNSKFLGFLEKNFPQEADILKGLKKTQIRDNAFTDGHLNPGKILREVDKLEPEIKKFLFNDESLKKIEAAKTYLDAMPKDVNPSGTAKAMHLFEYLKNPLSFGVQQASDFLKDKFIKQIVAANPGQAPLINALVHVADMTAKVGRGIEKHSGAIFSKAAQTMTESNKKEKQRLSNAAEPIKMDKIGTVVKNYMANPEALINHMTDYLTPVSDYAPNVGQALTSSISGGVQFLSAKLPVEDKNAPLDSKTIPNNSDIAKFNRYAEVVENPLSVLTHVKNGTILPQDLETLSTVYPALYNNMKSQVVDKLTNYLSKHDAASLPYKTKLGLSAFLGQNLDSTTMPQNIMNNQMNLVINELQRQQQQMQAVRPSKTGMSKMKSYENDMTSNQSAVMRHSQMRSI